MPDGTILRTVVDELLDLVKAKKKISVEDAAKELKMSLSSTQAIVDFLVEEKVFGIEYKFTTPFIYLYSEAPLMARAKEKGFTDEMVTRDIFYKKANEKNIPKDLIEGLWRKFLKSNLTQIREEFMKKSKEKKISEEKIEELWTRYLSYL